MIQCFGKYQHIFFLQNNNFTKRIKIEIGVVKVFMKSNRLQKILPIFDEKKTCEFASITSMYLV